MIDAATLRSLLTAWPVGRLATCDAEGNPHVVPVVFCAEDNVVYIPVDGKPKASTRLKRLANIQQNPRVSLLLDHYESDWRRLWWLRLDGAAEVYTPKDDHAGALAEMLRGKYPGYADTPVFAGVPTLIRLIPDAVNGWAPEGFETVVAGLA